MNTNANTSSIQQINETASIANRAMKFRLSRGGTKRRVRDRDAEAVVKQQLGDEGQIVSRQLFKDKSNLVGQYQNKANEMYAYHIKSTLPFGDEGSRVLPNTSYFTYTQKMNDFISELALLRNQILSTWDALVQADITQRNNDLAAQGKPQSAQVGDYPTVQQMENTLYVSWFPEPISTINDFRFNLEPEMLDVVQRQFDDMIAQCSAERFNRMLTPVSAFIEKLTHYKGDKGQRWYDSFVDNLAAIPEEIRALNIVDDPVVDTFIEEIEKMMRPYAPNPSMLKEDSQAREELKKKLEVLEGSLKGYCI